MANIFNDLNKLVNTVQKVDRMLTEKPRRKRTPMKPTIDGSLRNLITALSNAPKNELIGNLNYIVDNLNQLGTSYKITLDTESGS